jgi:hypothetical protein
MKTAVGAGVVAAVAGTVGIANAGPTTRDEVSHGAPAGSGAAPSAAGGPVVAHVVDRRAGTVELFTNGSRTQVHDADLATRIARLGSATPVVVHVADGGDLEVFSSGARSLVRDADLATRILHAA